MRIAIITDAWTPQVNGVVRTLAMVTGELRAMGHEVLLVTPDQFRTMACPGYPEIRLAMAGARQVGAKLAAFRPDAIHVATEGPLGWAARRWCMDEGRPFTTAYHTQFPQYLARRTGLPAGLFWPVIRRFHRRASAIMVATPTIAGELEEHGLQHIRPWSRGVDTAQFHPDHLPPELFLRLPRPIQLYVGRVAVEKNLDAFLGNTHPGSKVVVGDGPALAALKARYPQAHFLGAQSGPALAACYAAADVFVFPSRTDTFGLVLVEALACGTPVAAYPVAGPLDVLVPQAGAMDEVLERAIARALALDRAQCLAHGRSFSWAASARQFVAALHPVTASPASEPPALRAAA
ncbi:glycosyltransferase [Alteraurantiacibacter buctensis]|uniref:Glycosyltransferase n=1 Tax=Alteraurantiacibacter buctensis TaxID=1503981 RepID=A0A844YU65_9SPHN|nr:glycosyltransferase [Alteraurantiacibacter buctensis]